MLSVSSLSDEPDDIFKLFEFHRVVRRFQEELEESSNVRSRVEEIVLDSDDECKPAENDLSDSGQEEEDTSDLRSDELLQQSQSHSAKNEKTELNEDTLDCCLDLLGKEVIPDEELCNLPPDTLKQVFQFFMRSSFQMPDIDETSLGIFLLKKKEEQIEDLSTFELQQMLNFVMKENTMLEIQNEVFRRFLKKNDPRYDEEHVKTLEVTREIVPEGTSLEISSSEMTESKVVFPDQEDYESNSMFLEVLSLYTRVVEHEIRAVHKQYEKDLNKFTAKMEDLGAVQKSMKIHQDKMSQTFHLLNVLIIKKHKKKISFSQPQFAEFLKASIKQDQQDLRRLRVLTYEYNKKIASLKKTLKSHDRVRKVDLELYEIKSNELSAKIAEQNEEFLQLKKIFGNLTSLLARILKNFCLSHGLFLLFVSAAIVELHLAYRES
ncbi:hypothetical protein GE061_016855 [Apolygus lucorum]|uniref:DUF4201 domain-containing protein n=1 Tax=Apolygus lucorum TaxID=248454 RepID=A0A8S9XJE8_APOLU|nr:hypothetical protein GE061_016855 [Apolygus lucorum]